jgi:HAT1-interacting factor 1
LDRELNGSASAIAVTAPVVNDLTSMVVKKKKKKAPEDTSAALKRKVETEVQESSLEKKARLDTPES